MKQQHGHYEVFGPVLAAETAPHLSGIVRTVS